MDQDWAIEQLDEFTSAINEREQLKSIARVISGDETQELRLEKDMQEIEGRIWAAEPIAQMVMNAVENGLGDYDKHSYVDGQVWGWSWDVARDAALRAVGLVRLGAEAREKLRPAGPELTANDLHDWVWSAARPLWEAGAYSAAVHAAALSVNAQIQRKIELRAISDADLCTQLFSLEPPKPDRPRLRFEGDRSSQTWRSRQEGAGAFGRGCFQAMRNPAAHEHDHRLSAQEALEELAAFSRLCRWVEACSVEAWVADSPSTVS